MRVVSLFLAIFFFCTAHVFSQTSSAGFVIINDGNVNNIADYEYALEHNDLDKYRHIDQRTVLIFKRGVEVELLSATEAMELGLHVNLSEVNHDETNRFKHSEFVLHPSGRILEYVTPVKK